MVSIIGGRWSLWSRYLGEYRNKGKKDECLRRFEYRTDRSLLVLTTSQAAHPMTRLTLLCLLLALKHGKLATFCQAAQVLTQSTPR